MSESTVLSTKPGFRLFIGQPEEFPLMQVKEIVLQILHPTYLPEINYCSGEERPTVSWKAPLCWVVGGHDLNGHQAYTASSFRQEYQFEFHIPLAGQGHWPYDMLTLDPDRRGCRLIKDLPTCETCTQKIITPNRFTWESEVLDFHSKYSKTSCKLECKMKAASEKVDCLNQTIANPHLRWVAFLGTCLKSLAHGTAGWLHFFQKKARL